MNRQSLLIIKGIDKTKGPADLCPGKERGVRRVSLHRAERTPEDMSRKRPSLTLPSPVYNQGGGIEGGAGSWTLNPR